MCVRGLLACVGAFRRPLPAILTLIDRPYCTYPQLVELYRTRWLQLSDRAGGGHVGHGDPHLRTRPVGTRVAVNTSDRHLAGLRVVRAAAGSTSRIAPRSSPMGRRCRSVEPRMAPAAPRRVAPATVAGGAVRVPPAASGACGDPANPSHADVSSRTRRPMGRAPRHPSLTAVIITPFGLAGPWHDHPSRT